MDFLAFMFKYVLAVVYKLISVLTGNSDYSPLSLIHNVTSDNGYVEIRELRPFDKGFLR